MQRVARRDMQALADVVALDLARHVDGAGRRESARRSTPSSTLTRTGHPQPQRQPEAAGSTPTTLWSSRPSSSNSTTTASYATGPDGRPVEVDRRRAPDAVVVIASTEVDFGFAARRRRQTAVARRGPPWRSSRRRRPASTWAPTPRRFEPLTRDAGSGPLKVCSTSGSPTRPSTWPWRLSALSLDQLAERPPDRLGERLARVPDPGRAGRRGRPWPSPARARPVAEAGSTSVATLKRSPLARASVSAGRDRSPRSTQTTSTRSVSPVSVLDVAAPAPS